LSACGFGGQDSATEPAIDAGIDAVVAPSDSDRDGIEDSADNCPTVKNPKVMTLTPTGMQEVQRDHDGDGQGDACDSCPHIPGGDASDPDGDKIGAACDPAPAMANPPAIFDGFYEKPNNTDWTVPTTDAGTFADWSVVAVGGVNGVVGLRQVNPALGWYQVHYNTALQRAHVTAGMRIDGFSAASGNNVLRSGSVSFAHNVNGGTHNYLSCGLRRNVQNGQQEAILVAYNDELIRSGENQDTTWAGATIDRVVRVTGQVSLRDTAASTLACTVGDNMSSSSLTLDSALRPDGRVGLRAYGATVLFDYIFIVDLRPAT
jgi:hypothetical protein